MSDVSAILAISYRDLLKFLRDRPRLISAFIFPVLFIGVLGGSFRGSFTGYDYLPYLFTGVLAQTLFQSTALGTISLIEDRENDFSQEIFIAPISRYSIIFGKILGESGVAMVQGIVIIVFGMLVGVPISLAQALGLLLIGIIVCLFGGAFGVVVLGNIPNQRAANQLFPFIMFPQFFLAGVFTPLLGLPWYLDVLSRITPMRYVVDLARGVYYVGNPDYAQVVLLPPAVNLLLIVGAFAVFLALGTALFVRNERNR